VRADRFGKRDEFGLGPSRVPLLDEDIEERPGIAGGCGATGHLVWRLDDNVNELLG
jgi:hypothetical protein